MATENIVVELVVPASGKAGAFTAGAGVKSQRLAQVAAAAPTIVIDGVTYTRTSPLRTYRNSAGMGMKLDDNGPQDAATAFPPVVGSPSPGNLNMAVFSQSGT